MSSARGPEEESSGAWRAARARPSTVAPARPDATHRAWVELHFFAVSAGVSAAISVFLFAGALFSRAGDVWSKPGLDLTTALVPWWTYGFGEMRKGNFPLWNPHNFCGTPFFSNFNTGVLYPLHWLNLILPLDTALNIIGTADVWLAGWFTSLWCRGRGISAAGSILGGTVFMCSGAYFAHVYPGHEPSLAAVGWTPLILLSIDGIFGEQPLKWSLIGMFAVGMQILASFAQAVYLTGLIASLYFALCFFKLGRKTRPLVPFLLIYAGGACLGAVQLLPGLQTAHESVRQAASEEFTAQYSLPPENLLTLVAPRIFGDIEHSPYIGRSYIWEASLFCGVSTLLLAGCGAAWGDPARRRFSVTLLLVSLVLALGAYIGPLFKLLFHVLPLYASFRVTARFDWFIALYVAMLAALGYDLVSASLPGRARLAWLALAGAVGAGLLGLVCFISARSGQLGLWGRILHALAFGSDQKNDPEFSGRRSLVLATGTYAGVQLLIAALTLLATSAALWLLKRSPQWKKVLACIVVAEMLFNAHGAMVHGPMVQPAPGAWTTAANSARPEHRLLHPSLDYANTAMIQGFDDVYGYDPVALKRYSDLLAMTQGYDPDKVHFAPQPVTLCYRQVFRMLRCEYVCRMCERAERANGERSDAGSAEVIPLSSPLGRLVLIDRFRIGHGRREILAALARPDFDPLREVWLESAPDPSPSQVDGKLPPGTAQVVRSSTDWLDIRVSLRHPAILLITDAYSRSWRARPLVPGPQKVYTVMPADYALRAIPLAQGEHFFRMEYLPLGFAAGKWISLASMLLWIAAWAPLTRPAMRRSWAADAGGKYKSPDAPC